jgi:hypothetical protein
MSSHQHASCRVVSCRVVSCRVVSCRVVSCRVVSCRVASCCIVLSVTVPTASLHLQVKMSKSLGNVVSPLDLLPTFGVDGVRYFLLRDGGVTVDGDFSMDALQRRFNCDLADTLGNLGALSPLRPCLSASVSLSSLSPNHTCAVPSSLVRWSVIPYPAFPVN